MHAGFAGIDITPAPGLPTAGMPGAPPATGVRWPLHGRVAAFDDGERTVAVVSLDLLALQPATVADLRRALTEGTVVAPADVFIACSHTHSAPHTVFLLDDDADPGFLALLEERLPQALRSALDRLEPVELRFGRTATSGLTFNRRPVYRGEEVGTQGPLWVDDFVRLEGPADEELQVVAAVREDGSLAGGLVGFACHPTVMGLETLYSADFPGVLVEELGRRHGCVFAFLQGAAGQLLWSDMSRPPEGGISAEERTERLGTALADAADAALSAAVAVADGRIRVSARTLRIAQRRPTRKQVEAAYAFLRRDAAAEAAADFARDAYGHRYTFYSSIPQIETWFARETIGMWEWQRRNGPRAPYDALEVQVLALGDLALVGFPGELFTEFGLRTKSESPFPKTVVCELANGWHGYVPTVEAFAHGGYEPRLGYQSRLVPEAGDLLVDAALEQLALLRGAA